MTKSKNFLNNLIKTLGFSSSRESNNEEDLERIAQQEQKNFPLEILVAATKDFHINNRLGEGGLARFSSLLDSILWPYAKFYRWDSIAEEEYQPV